MIPSSRISSLSLKPDTTHGGEHGLLEALYEKQEKYYAEGKVDAEDLAQTCDRLGRRKRHFA